MLSCATRGERGPFGPQSNVAIVSDERQWNSLWDVFPYACGFHYEDATKGRRAYLPLFVVGGRALVLLGLVLVGSSTFFRPGRWLVVAIMLIASGVAGCMVCTLVRITSDKSRGHSDQSEDNERKQLRISVVALMGNVLEIFLWYAAIVAGVSSIDSGAFGSKGIENALQALASVAPFGPSGALEVASGLAQVAVFVGGVVSLAVVAVVVGTVVNKASSRP